MNLTEKALLVSLSVSSWTARRQSTAATREVQRAFSASDKAGRFTKHLVPPEALQDIQSITAEMRTLHYTLSLPWLDGGVRVLPSDLYLRYTQEMGKLRDRFDAGVDRFIEDYPLYVEQAKHALGRLFNPGDYPSAAAIRFKFGVTLSVIPFPSTQDFRVAVRDEDMRRMREEAEESIRAATVQSQHDVVRRITDAVGRMASSLSVPDKVFHDTMLENLRDLGELLPALNILGDPRIDEVTTQISKLGSYNPLTLRSDRGVRADAAAEAQAVMNKMGVFFGGAR